MACRVDRTAVPIGLRSWSHRVCSERRRLPAGSVSHWSSAAIVALSSEPMVISGTGPDSSVGGVPFTTPTPWSGEPSELVPTSRFSQPTRALEPGCASSTSSIAEKWERLAVVSPVAWTTARLPAFHIGSSGASFGCSPKRPSVVPASSWSCGTAMVGRAE